MMYSENEMPIERKTAGRKEKVEDVTSASSYSDEKKKKQDELKAEYGRVGKSIMDIIARHKQSK